jgi:hypothetical protein
MELNDIKDQIKKNVKWDSKRPPERGGQMCGMPNYPVILKCEDLDLEIIVGTHRSQLKNKELAWVLFELALDDLVK